MNPLLQFKRRLLASILAAGALWSTQLPAAESRPNVLFIAVDDLRCELGCYGVKEIKSPNFDRLAASGVAFTRAYCQLAVCNPSRASLMTGLRPDTTRVWYLMTDFRRTIPDAVTIPQHFRQHGYRALGFGKIFHNTFPDDVSWDAPHVWPENGKLWSDDAKKQLKKLQAKMGAEGKPEAAIKRLRSLGTERVDIPDSEHVDGAMTDQAIAAMRELAGKDQPFFLAAGFIRPHLPFVVPRKYWDLYDPTKIPLASNAFLPRGAPGVAFGDRSMGGLYELRDYMDYRDVPSPFEGSLSEAQQRELKHGYYASVSFIDAQVGRLLDELDRLGLAEKTIVVLWSDHGWKLGEHNGWCKQTNYEIDTRVPLMIRAPGAKSNGRQSNALVEFVDVYPTLCELASLPVPKVLEGKSLAPLLDGTATKTKNAAFSQFPRKHAGSDYMGYAMRTERYRYIEWLNAASGKVAERELYDHETDADENENIAAKSGELIASLSAQMWKTLPRPAAAKPNILFLMADDWSSPHAGALGDPVVKTPTFDRVAREGVLFHNAFVSSPSCTPSRLSIATGQWHWRLKEGEHLGGALREGVPVYPELLQAAGYEIGFSRKGATPSDYKFTHRDPFGPKFKTFEEFHAKHASNKPFCFWYGAGEPHRAYRFGEGVKAGIDPAKVKLPACLPDNETTRADFCDYLNRVQRYDADCAEMLALLEKSGELENTIIVMSGDNGLPFPRCKATLYDTGTHVPLAIRWGAQVKGGRSIQDFVSLTDLAPTFLEAAGLKIPGEMTGRSLLATLRSKASGQVEAARTAILTGMGRHVYAYPSRALRTAEFLYIRNTDPAGWPTGESKKTPPKIDFTDGSWPKHEGAFSFNIDPSPTKQFLLDHRSDPAVAPFFALACGPRADEELYDLKADPDQLRNVAADPKYAAQRNELRAQLSGENKPAAARPKLQIINGSAQPIDIFWLKSDSKRVPNGALPPGKDSIITTTLGHRFVIVGRDDKAEATITCEVPVQGFRFDPPSRTGVPSFYTQSASAGGFPIVASAKVNPYALKEAAFLIGKMLANRPDVREALVKSGARMCIMGREEFTTDLPEFARLGTEPQPQFPGIDPKDYWDRRARGTGGSQTDPFCSSAEENILGFPGDPYVKECILIHEFAHCIHLRGMVNVDPTFDTRLKATYESAMKAGLWSGKYASVNRFEYFAEGVQSWFDDNRENDHDHNHVNTRAELLEYDPGLAAMCREVFGDTELKYTKPATRLTDHMAGYDPSKAPTFVWPERLAKADVAIKASVKARNDKASPRETRQVSGWTVHINKELLAKDAQLTERVLALLKAQLDEVIRVVPAPAVAELKKVPLWINPEYPNTRPSAEYHPDAKWLIDNKRDPVMAKGVEITNVRIFEAETRRMPNVTLHELAHAYHDRVVRKGFSNLEIKAAYKNAKSSGKYDRVERHLGNGKPNTFERAYAMTNPQEYFAETSEALFVGNDFFPFTRDELKQHDPEMLEVLLKLWGVSSR